ncbi:A disintegrin and metalloproteinase with thrombospondin motifs 1 isoform X2 [Bradysia coprophila]|uniref:A disintegrin and metalloproteinase with thrombospondin motifs 1 isoform X2 n=1 Tax=Bradysia coprophila TaxID=38358 RepID=UPI00187DB3E0|nr:A disintegrin and metalloproteinase with thrombospondin motifs 1 isoform X2 [Bradysia coprophila]
MVQLSVYIATWTLFCTCSAYPDIHKQMSESQLRSIFHVDSHDLVPHYELIKLTHHGTSHHINKRSTNTISTSDKKSTSSAQHHVKKDLSKSAYFSELKNSIAQQQQISENISINSNRNNASSDSDTTVHVDLGNVSEHNVSLSAFGNVYNLTLRPTDGLFKDGPQGMRMWSVDTNPNATQGLEYDEIIEDSSEHIGDIFQDQSNMAAILMRRQLENGDLLMEGSIGHDLVIRPVPTELTKHLEDSSTHHIVFKRNSDAVDQNSDFAYMEPDRLLKRYRRKRSTTEFNITTSDSGLRALRRSSRAVPHIIYPEILVIVDYDGYRLHGGDNVQVKRYFVSFWNGVDLRYRLLKGPRIRISIAGIIISRGRDATPYLERNRVGRDAIDSAAALTDMGKYLFRERRLPVYDIAVAITKYDMCRRRKGGRCTKGTAGFAYVGGACVVNKRLEKVNSVAIIEDTGGFSGIIVAAHEVGHLLGAVHDGSPPPSYLGGPGAEKCRWEDGFIMSDLRHTERGFRWSPCTVQSFHHFLNGDTASCLHNAPHEDEALGRALPGTLLSLDAQCRRDRGTSACFKDERVCAQLFCFDAASGYCVAYRPAAEGSTCGDGSHCLDGRCVAEHENIIPDYSQHTPSYASPNAFNPQINTEAYNYYEVPETTSTTTTTTTTPTPTTTKPTYAPQSTKNYFSDPFFYRYYTSKSTTEDPYKYYTQSSTPFDYYKFYDLSSPTTTTTTTTQPPTKRTISPYYFGLNYQKDQKTSTKFYYNSYPTTSTTPTTKKTPYVYSNYFSTSPSTRWTTTTAAPTTTTTTTVSPTAKKSQSSYTRNPVFDVYLKRLASTTKSPYNFENFAQYFKTSTTNPKFSYNLFGANSNNSPLNSTATVVSTG